MADEPLDRGLDGGLSKLPVAVSRLAAVLADITDSYCVLNNGSGALYWHLVGTLAEHIERARSDVPMMGNPALFDLAKKVSHEFGYDWTDPRTGITYRVGE